MRLNLNLLLILSLVFIGASREASAKSPTSIKKQTYCLDMQVLLKAAEDTISDAMKSDTDDSVSDYLVLGGDPSLEELNVNGKDLWTVPIVVDGEGCYGNVDLTMKAGTCEIVGEPSFDGVSCTNE